MTSNIMSSYEVMSKLLFLGRWAIFTAFVFRIEHMSQRQQNNLWDEHWWIVLLKSMKVFCSQNCSKKRIQYVSFLINTKKVMEKPRCHLITHTFLKFLRTQPWLHSCSHWQYSQATSHLCDVFSTTVHIAVPQTLANNTDVLQTITF